jgi:hypothetical protein
MHNTYPDSRPMVTKFSTRPPLRQAYLINAYWTCSHGIRASQTGPQRIQLRPQNLWLGPQNRYKYPLFSFLFPLSTSQHSSSTTTYTTTLSPQTHHTPKTTTTTPHLFWSADGNCNQSSFAGSRWYLHYSTPLPITITITSNDNTPPTSVPRWKLHSITCSAAALGENSKSRCKYHVQIRWHTSNG